ncbi:MAG: hypothetical protein WAM14_06745 [Candidatus Nitrosopolaris sp.]
MTYWPGLPHIVTKQLLFTIRVTPYCDEDTILNKVLAQARLWTPIDFIDEGKEQGYDKAKYRDMLLEAAETDILVSIGHYTEILVEIKTGSGGISLGMNVEKT